MGQVTLRKACIGCTASTDQICPSWVAPAPQGEGERGSPSKNQKTAFAKSARLLNNE